MLEHHEFFTNRLTNKQSCNVFKYPEILRNQYEAHCNKYTYEDSESTIKKDTKDKKADSGYLYTIPHKVVYSILTGLHIK
jgi:hypothetical protein